MEIRRKFIAFLILVAVPLSARSQNGVWQWAVDMENHSVAPKYKHPEAYLWIPENCREVKALIVAQHNMEEISILEDEGFRKRMARLGVAELWICPRFNLPFDFTDGAWESLDAALARLAEESGYTELTEVPIIGIGHSAAASNPYYMAASRPDRVLACISTSGQWPYFRDGNFCPDVWDGRNINFIPCLETMGEYESAESFALRGLKEKAEHPNTALSMLACPGEGHFAASEEKAEYIAMFIRKALKYGHMDPKKEGWLAQRWKRDEAPSCRPAPVGRYKGDPSEAFWFFDGQMARATLRYQNRFRGLKTQLVGLIQERDTVPQQNTHMQLHPEFKTDADGLTMHFGTFFYDTVSSGSPRHRAWSGLEPGKAIGHSSKGNPYLEIIAAPAVVSSDSTLTLSWNRMATWEEKEVFIDFCIKHPGDEKFRPAVQQARITLPIRLTEGAEQHITFAPLPDVKSSSRPIVLDAHSDSGLKVGFYAECGPVRIEGDTLYFTKIPPKAKFPIKVSVVAWQYGVRGKVQTAEAVRQVFHINK